MIKFNKQAQSFSGQSRTASVMRATQSVLNSSSFQLSTESSKVLGDFLTMSNESITPDQTQVLGDLANNVSDATATIVNNSESEDDPITSEEVENIEESILISQKPAEYVQSVADRPQGVIISGLGGEADIGAIELGKESYEQHHLMNTTTMTVGFNLKSERQSKAVELFFETVNLDVNASNLTIDLTLSTVFVPREYDISGKGDQYRNQMNIIKALRHASILRSDYTDIIPHFVPGVNEDSFVPTTVVPVRQVTNVHGETFETSYLTVGRTIQLLGISQTDRQAHLGGQNFTDQISGSVRLKSLAVKIGSDVVSFNGLQHHAMSGFTYTPTGDSQDIQLMYNVNTHLINKDTVSLQTQALPTEWDALKSKNLEALLTFHVVGTGNTDYGTVNLTSNPVRVHQVRDADTKEVKDLTSPDIKTLVDAIEKAEIVGYELDATRTNGNIREHGLVLDTRLQRLIYGVRLHSPISVVTADSAKGDISDSARVQRLVEASFARRTNAGVTAIYEILNLLKSQPTKLDTVQLYANSSIGVGQYYVNTYVRDISIDVLTAIQSLQTSDKTANVSSLLCNVLQVEATKAYCESELAAALEMTTIGSSGFKPHVIAIADVFTSKFLSREGDARPLGDGFDFTLEECCDKRLVTRDDGVETEDGEYGTIFMSFGRPKQGNLSVPLFFGQCLSKREIVHIVDRSRGSAYSHEVIMQPWFSPICHLPILVRVIVENLGKAIKERTPFAITGTVKQNP